MLDLSQITSLKQKAARIARKMSSNDSSPQKRREQRSRSHHRLREHHKRRRSKHTRSRHFSSYSKSQSHKIHQKKEITRIVIMVTIKTRLHQRTLFTN